MAETTRHDVINAPLKANYAAIDLYFETNNEFKTNNYG